MIIRIAKNQKEIFSLLKLRRLVFINQQKVDVNIEQDDDDIEAIHFIVLDQDKIIGTCRLVINQEKAKLGRMVVSEEYRHRNIGSSLLKFCEDYALENNIEKIIVAAQLEALDFYLKNGYLVNSQVFYEANIAHRMVEKFLK